MGYTPPDHPDLESFGTIDVTIRVSAELYQDAIEEYQRALQDGYDSGLDTFLFNRCPQETTIVVETDDGDVVLDRETGEPVDDVQLD